MIQFVTPSIEELKVRWLPHRERLNAKRQGHPTPIRFHRACSWLAETERLDPISQVDQILIYQWIALNSLYGQWDQARHEALPDRECWKVFFERVLDLDVSGCLVSLLAAHRGLVLSILGNGYLNRYFWQTPSSENAGRAGNGGRHKAASWYAEKRWLVILEQVLDRVYLLRCQLVHGAATLGSRLNRAALKHCAAFLGILLPAVLSVLIDLGADEDWGLLCYPPVADGSESRRRPR